MKPIPEILKHYLKYNPETGELFWIIKPAMQIQIGSLAGSIRADYYSIRFAGKDYPAHRVIWFLCYGNDPGKLEIDHKNLNKLDNRISNLRLATRSQNSCNRKASRNKIGTKGICLRNRKWHTCLTKNRETVLNRRFHTKGEAKQTLDQYRSKFHGEFANFS